jgi:hypothetical protein
VTLNLPDKIQSEMAMARALATSSLVPKDFRGQPANILLAIGLGNALGIEPAVALTEIKVIDGTPSLSAHLQAALVRRAGHKLRIERGKDSATAIVIRKDDPGHEHKATWTMERAKQAGLAGRGAWRAYPEAMLVNRAITEVIRFAASDVLMGVAYDPEELSPVEDADDLARSLGAKVVEVGPDVEIVVERIEQTTDEGTCELCQRRRAETSYPDGQGDQMRVCARCEDDLASQEADA